MLSSGLVSLTLTEARFSGANAQWFSSKRLLIANVSRGSALTLTKVQFTFSANAHKGPVYLLTGVSVSPTLTR